MSWNKTRRRKKNKELEWKDFAFFFCLLSPKIRLYWMKKMRRTFVCLYPGTDTVGDDGAVIKDTYGPFNPEPSTHILFSLGVAFSYAHSKPSSFIALLGLSEK